MSKNAIGRLVSVKVLRGEGGGMSDQYLVNGKLRLGIRWMRIG